jgi:aminoglycoside phosphotransferase (APT) family kinase protein
MQPVKMHANEVAIDTALVQQLLTEQFPQWSNLPISHVSSSGTVNAIFRLGDALAARLPRIDWGINDVAKEHQWLPRLAPYLPLAIPVPLAKGAPGAGYPWQWSVYRWLKGEHALVAQQINLDRAARDLAHFVTALRRVDFADGPPSGRGSSFAARDVPTRRAIEALRNDGIDGEVVTEMWDSCLETPVWSGPPLWTHGDLIPTNLLVDRGRISAVIDFGDVGMGDPACDLTPAWSLLTRNSRQRFRSMLAVDDEAWARGRGWALSQALLIVPYYRDTNPGLVAIAKRMIAELLDDYQNAAVR